MQTFQFPSKSGGGTYTTRIADDGLLDCNCRGYLIKKPNKPRYCTHTDEVVRKLKLQTVTRGDQMFALEAGSAQLDLLPEVDHAGNYKSAIDRGYINPMLASAPEKNKRVEDYAADDYILEEKYDGERKVVSVVHGVSVYTWNRPRSGKGEVGKEEPLPEHLQKAAIFLPTGVYDGELILPGANKSSDVNRLENRPHLCLVLFDYLRMVDKDVMHLPYWSRRQMLKMCVDNLQFSGTACIYVSEIYEPTQENVKLIWARGGEGAILKRKDSTYRPGHRTADWVKIKQFFQERFQIVGYKKGKNGPHSTVLLEAEDGSPTQVKFLNNAWLAKLDAEPDKYLGKWMIVEHQGRMASGGYRHPMWQYLEEEVDNGDHYPYLM